MGLTVLFVTGWCRSGSTVLGNVLGELSGVFHTGELRFLWRNGVLGTGSNRRCGCGDELIDCPVWSKVLADGQPADRSLAEHAADVVGWQDSFRTRHTFRTLRRPPATGPTATGPTANRWPDTLARTYHSIAEQTGANVIVDSSKFAADAALGRRLDGIEPRYVQLVRDPRGVALSWLNPKDYTGHRGVLNSTWYWLGFNLAAEAVNRADPAAALRIRYEDLTAAPRDTLDQVLTLLGRPTSENPIAPDGSVALGGNHTVTGNPNRFERGSIRLTEDTRWHRGLSGSKRLATTALAAPLLGRYDYPHLRPMPTARPRDLPSADRGDRHRNRHQRSA